MCIRDSYNSQYFVCVRYKFRKMFRAELFFQNEHACQNTENYGMLLGKGLGRYWDATGTLLCKAIEYH